MNCGDKESLPSSCRVVLFLAFVRHILLNLLWSCLSHPHPAPHLLSSDVCFCCCCYCCFSLPNFGSMGRFPWLDQNPKPLASLAAFFADKCHQSYSVIPLSLSVLIFHNVDDMMPLKIGALVMPGAVEASRDVLTFSGKQILLALVFAIQNIMTLTAAWHCGSIFSWWQKVRGRESLFQVLSWI